MATMTVISCWRHYPLEKARGNICCLESHKTLTLWFPNTFASPLYNENPPNENGLLSRRGPSHFLWFPREKGTRSGAESHSPVSVCYGCLPVPGVCSASLNPLRSPEVEVTNPLCTQGRWAWSSRSCVCQSQNPEAKARNFPLPGRSHHL